MLFFGVNVSWFVTANALLDHAGWTRGADGIRVKNGLKLNLTIATRAGSPDIDAQLALLREDWKQIGVGLNVHHYPPALMFAPPQKGGAVNGNTWDVTTFAWAADPLGDYSAIYGCRSFPPAGQNDLRWCNKTAQVAMEALVGHYEQSQRIDDLKILMREFVDEAPSIVSFLHVDLFAYNRDLKHYHPNNLTPFDNMMDVDIEQRRATEPGLIHNPWVILSGVQTTADSLFRALADVSEPGFRPDVPGRHGRVAAVLCGLGAGRGADRLMPAHRSTIRGGTIA